jgi:hypothetical protein
VQGGRGVRGVRMYGNELGESSGMPLADPLVGDANKERSRAGTLLVDHGPEAVGFSRGEEEGGADSCLSRRTISALECGSPMSIGSCPACHPPNIHHHISQSVGQLVSQSDSQTVSQIVNWPVSQTVSRQSVTQTVRQTVSQAGSQSYRQPGSHSINHSDSQSVKQTRCHCINQPTNRPTTNHPPYGPFL